MKSSIFTNQKGYAAITAAIFTLVVSLTIISAFALFALQETNTNRAYVKSIDAHYISESGIEDATYRIVAGKQIGASQDIGVGDGTTTVSVTTAGDTQTIRSEGTRDTFQQNLQTAIKITTDTINFHYGVQVGDGGISMSTNVQIIGNIYSNGSITGSSGDTITGDATVAGGINADPQVQWTTNNSDQTFATSSASRDIAQSFTATAGGSVPKVSVLLGKTGNPGADITIRITTDNSNKPNTSSLASATIKNTSVGTSPSWIDTAFSSPPTLTNGTTYWIVLDFGSNSTTNYWNWRKDDTDAYASNTGKYSNDWSSGGAVWKNANGDLAFKVWIGGTNTKIDSVTIGDASSGTGHANLFTNATVHGSACPNSYCVIENPPRAELPITDGVIQDWKNDATCSDCTIINSDYNVSGNKTLGPAKINGNLTFSNDATLTLTGTIWVTGTIDVSKNCLIQLDSGYGNLSGILMSDGNISVAKDCTFKGSGTPGSYVLLLTTKDAPTSTVMDIDKSSSGVVYYAGKGRIHLAKDAGAKEVTAYGIDIDKDSTITYDSGLANAQFSSGPGAGYEINQWKEVK